MRRWWMCPVSWPPSGHRGMIIHVCMATMITPTLGTSPHDGFIDPVTVTLTLCSHRFNTISTVYLKLFACLHEFKELLWWNIPCSYNIIKIVIISLILCLKSDIRSNDLKLQRAIVCICDGSVSSKMSSCHDVRMSRCQDVTMPGCQDVTMSRCDVRMCVGVAMCDGLQPAVYWGLTSAALELPSSSRRPAPVRCHTNPHTAPASTPSPPPSPSSVTSSAFFSFSIVFCVSHLNSFLSLLFTTTI